MGAETRRAWPFAAQGKQAPPLQPTGLKSKAIARYENLNEPHSSRNFDCDCRGNRGVVFWHRENSLAGAPPGCGFADYCRDQHRGKSCLAWPRGPKGEPILTRF